MTCPHRFKFSATTSPLHWCLQAPSLSEIVLYNHLRHGTRALKGMGAVFIGRSLDSYLPVGR